MFDVLIGKLRLHKTTRELKRLPAVRTGRALVQANWVENHVAIQDFSPGFVSNQEELMMEQIVKIALSPNPVMANRQMLADCVCELAQFSVLTLDPPPASDETGLRGQVGITGELKPRLFELYYRDKGLREFFQGLENSPRTWDDVWNPVLLRYRIVHSWASVFHGLRYVLDDCNKNGKDWFRAFVAAMSGFQESIYRRTLDMPSSFDETSGISPDLKPLMLSMFLNCVLSEARYPDFEWKERVAEIEKGNYAWRLQSWLE
jgi:hypothetical protein